MPRFPARTASVVGGDKERLAGDYLRQRGLRLIACNYRCRFGEIDLVMREAETLVFVEVRFRKSSRYGTPAETIDAHKQRRLAATASYYLREHPTNSPCRFDVLAVSGNDNIVWIRDAFHAE